MQFFRYIAPLLPLAILVASMGEAHGQDRDSRGKEFWLAFMPNNGNNQSTSDLRLYLSAQSPTTARITWVRTGASITIPISRPNNTVEVDLSGRFSGAVELDDIDFFGANQIQQKAIHVEADDEISVVGMNYRAFSCDAFLGLPADVLTGEYIVVAHRNGLVGTNPAAARYDMPSQFSVVGMADGTTVRIIPKSGLLLNRRMDDSPFVVTLNAGDVFFAQAALDGPSDVSGTQVIGSKPVSVFGGVKRASIPTWWGTYRDHLVEQLPPLQCWGRNAMVTPYYPLYTALPDTAEYRVTAAFGPTDVTVIGSSTSQSFTLAAGNVLEMPLLEAASVVASGPILVTQYERSTPLQMSGISGIGDPFMMIIPPVEQFDTSYTVQSIRHARIADTAHYLNLVAPVDGVGGLTIDGTVTAANWSSIPGSRFVYAQLNVAPGSHYLRADSPFAVYAYGYGQAVSYGYPGAMVFRRLVRDGSPPEIISSQLCGRYQGIATDSRIADSGIDSLFAMPDTVNVIIDIPPFGPDADTVFFSAQLTDPFSDGMVAVKAIDSSGLSFTQKTGIPGFTLGVNGDRSGASLVDTLVAINANEFCKRLTVVNYGAYQQRIVEMRLVDSIPEARITTAVPLTIEPGDSTIVEVCFTGLKDTTVSVSLELVGTCSRRLAAIIPVDSRIDTTAAGIRHEGPECADEVYLVYSKSERASRIASIEVDTTINGTARLMSDPKLNPLPIVRVRLSRTDPFYDMIYQITVVDSVGNTLVDRDTIGGFTIAALNFGRDSVGLRWNRSWSRDTLPTSARSCDSIELVNYGLRDVDLSSVRLRGNTRYSVPPAQLPMRIPAGESRPLIVCLESPFPYDQIDTLELRDLCGHVDVVGLKTPVRALLGSGSDGCRGKIEVSAFEAAKRTFMTAPVPNPMTGEGYVDIGLARDEVVSLQVLDLRGRPVAPLMRQVELPAGLLRFTFDLSQLETGGYILLLTTAGGEVVTQRGLRAK